MSPIIIIPDSQEEITLKTEDFKKYISDAYYSGYNEGYEKGKNEKPIPAITYRDINKIDTTPYCGDTVTLLNKTDDLLRSKA